MDNWFEVMDDSGNVGLVPGNFIDVIEDSSANRSATPSTIEEAHNSTNQTTDSYNYSDGYNTYSTAPVISDKKQPFPDISHFEVKPEIVEEFDPFANQSQNQSNKFFENNEMKQPKSCLRSAPDIPRSPTEASKPDQQLSPHRPPPPVPKHKANKFLRRSTESIDSINLSRHDPIRASITSNSSSGSGKSEIASGVTIPVPSADDQRRLDERKKKVCLLSLGHD